MIQNESIERDKKKLILCKEHNVKLIYYDSEHGHKNFLNEKVYNTKEEIINVLKLNKLCDDVYYPDSNTNNKCSNYKVIYEQVVNYFVSDIANYNKNVKQCNKSITDNKISIYKTNKKYIDYNNDKKYDGKDVK